MSDYILNGEIHMEHQVSDVNREFVDLRKRTGLSRKAFCEKYGIPYMTATDWELNKHKMPAYLLRLLAYATSIEWHSKVAEEYFTNNQICHSWNQQSEYRCTFPVVVRHDIVPTQHIHPIQQQAAVDIHDGVKQDGRINAIVLFGSSITLRCDGESDLDLVVILDDNYSTVQDKNEISEHIQELGNWNCDILWGKEINKESQLYHNVLKGVQIL